MDIRESSLRMCYLRLGLLKEGETGRITKTKASWGNLAGNWTLKEADLQGVVSVALLRGEGETEWTVEAADSSVGLLCGSMGQHQAFPRQVLPGYSLSSSF